MRNDGSNPLSEIPADLIAAGIESAHPVTDGHIHRTWMVVDGDGSKLAVQALATGIFDDPAVLGRNLEIVVGHLRQAGIATLEPVAVGPDRTAISEIEGSVWRASRWIDGRAPVADDPADVRLVATAFGSFDAALRGADGLVEVIARFHDPEHRVELLESVMASDPVGRVGYAEEGLRRISDLHGRLRGLLSEWRQLPVRVAHNDAKLANVVVTGDGEAIVIDLDTVMPGTVLSDLGELVRSRFGPTDDTTADGQPDVSRIVEIVLGFTETYGSLEPVEKHLAPYAGLVLTFENAVRFLADFLAGDIYFSARDSGQNLRRALTQIALAERLDAAAVDIAGEVGSVLGP